MSDLIQADTETSDSSEKSPDYLPLWAVNFRGHIHEDREGKLAVFATRREARRWIDLHGLPKEMSIMKIER